MGVESTYLVRKKDAIARLRGQNVEIFDNDCNERLELMLNEVEEDIFENYAVVNDDYEEDEWDEFRF